MIPSKPDFPDDESHPRILASSLQGIEASDAGTGLIIQCVAQRKLVAGMILGGPAYNSKKIAVNDTLLAIDSVPVSCCSHLQIAAMLSGAADTSVVLLLEPAPDSQSKFHQQHLVTLIRQRLSGQPMPNDNELGANHRFTTAPYYLNSESTSSSNHPATKSTLYACTHRWAALTELRIRFRRLRAAIAARLVRICWTALQSCRDYTCAVVASEIAGASSKSIISGTEELKSDGPGDPVTVGGNDWISWPVVLKALIDASKFYSMDSSTPQAPSACFDLKQQFQCTREAPVTEPRSVQLLHASTPQALPSLDDSEEGSLSAETTKLGSSCLNCLIAGVRASTCIDATGIRADPDLETSTSASPASKTPASTISEASHSQFGSGGSLRMEDIQIADSFVGTPKAEATGHRAERDAARTAEIRSAMPAEGVPRKGWQGQAQWRILQAAAPVVLQPHRDSADAISAPIDRRAVLLSPKREPAKRITFRLERLLGEAKCAPCSCRRALVAWAAAARESVEREGCNLAWPAHRRLWALRSAWSAWAWKCFLTGCERGAVWSQPEDASGRSAARPSTLDAVSEPSWLGPSPGMPSSQLSKCAYPVKRV